MLLRESCWMNWASRLMMSRWMSSPRWAVFCTKHHPTENGESMNVILHMLTQILFIDITETDESTFW